MKKSKIVSFPNSGGKPYEIINDLVERAAEIDEIVVLFTIGGLVYFKGSKIESFDRMVGHMERIKYGLLSGD